ncbi:MAG TPA: GNAT family N-acetyltransferase [Candidatus Dormibacteraeota bacterium]|nr:GNAT family N-acetyltransferase [Candidatus Dormibacteraeota bacterium]
MTGASVHRVGPEEWSLFREVRLAALEDAPSAFWTTAAVAGAMTEVEWRRRLADSACFVAVADGWPVGLAAGIDEEPGVAELISMWVDPSWRGRGVADQLMTAVSGWAAGEGLARLQLWVAVGNDTAERLYARHQFVRTGRVQAMHPDEPARREFEMACVVSR